jgi:hypothetical protein
MLWTPKQQFHPWDFDKEAELESAIMEVQTDLFGESRFYLDVKKLIGKPGKTQNIPDGYLVDLSSHSTPVLYLVEVELAKHDPLRHVAQQLLSFSLSFKSTPQKMKGIVRNTLQKSPETLAKCEHYAKANNFNNIDYLLEQMIYPENAFHALVIIDELEEELESILISSLRFPVETLTLQRFRSEDSNVVFQFEPFLYDLSVQSATEAADAGNTPSIDPSEIDTIVVPAQEEGFAETFLAEKRWYQIRIHPSMIPRIKYIAAYQTSPVSAITHVAPVKDIALWKEGRKYVLNFSEGAKPVGPLKLVPKPHGIVKAPQAPRYTSYARLMKAMTLDDAF